MNVTKTTNSPPRIMVVDDEKDILSIIKRGLESNNAFTIETFQSADSALDTLFNHDENYYDLILTDIRMPKMNGFELYRKAKEKFPNIKVVFITAFEINREEFNKVIPSVDVLDFITKPVSITSLSEKLRNILNLP